MKGSEAAEAHAVREDALREEEGEGDAHHVGGQHPVRGHGLDDLRE